MIDFVTRQLSASSIVVEVTSLPTDMDRNYFFDCISELIDSGFKHVVIECHRLGYLNSSGLASLLMARKRAHRNGGKIYLTHLSSKIAAILELTKLGRILSIYPTTDDAMNSIGSVQECVT